MPTTAMGAAGKDSVITGPWGAISVPEVSLPAFVMAHWERRGDTAAVIDASTGQVLSYSQLAAAVRRTASGLLRRGLAPGDVFALCCPNSPEFAVAFYGALAAGGVVTTLSTQITAAEAAVQLGDAKARWAMTSAALADIVATAAGPELTELFVVGDASHGVPFDSLTEGSAPATLARVRPQDVAVLPYSSGTTGLPKGVMLTHRNLVAGLCSLQGPEPVRDGDVVLAALPLSHIAGLHIVMNHALASGATVVTMPRFDLEDFLGLIERHRVTRVVVAPPIVLALARHPRVDGYDLSSLRVLTSGAAPLAGEVARAAARRLGCRVKQGYGMTECAPMCIAPDDGPNRPESIGPPAPGVECRVVDVEMGAAVPSGQTGELWARSPAVMAGYLGQEAATAATVDADGWLHTGDIVRVDADGWFHVVDRVKELIKYKGHQVPPAELEEVLLAHPAVADAAVVGRPDEEAGEVAQAFVVLRHPAEPAELLAFVAERVAPYKRIRRLEQVADIPKSPSGKILRRVLLERELTGTGR